MAATLEIDAVIDPASTRDWLLAVLEAGRVRPAVGPLAIDTW
jgi:acetyl-CoA carboxylase carboxyltransferase component